MTKRLLSLALTLVLVLGLFAGLAAPASADGEIGQIFGQYLTGDKIDELFTGDIVKHGYCGKNNPGYVQYDIYRVDTEKVRELQGDTSIIEQNDLFQKLRERFPDLNVDGQDLLPDLSFDLPEGQDYYAIKFWGYGDGEMEDYSLTKKAPWRDTVLLDDGTEVKMEERLIALYVEGQSKTNASHTGVTTIGDRAFFGQDMLMLGYLGETVKRIGEKAFETCDRLSAINFPSNLESLGRRAFYACDYLTFARMNTCTKLKELPERAFCTCSHLTEIAFPPNVTSIGDFAFAWDHMLGTNRFNLPNALKTIGTGAFAFCTHLGIVNDIAIPANTTNIGNWAFTCCFNLGRSAGGIDIYPGTPGAELALTIGTGAFAGCSSLEKINFPNRVAFINDYAFAACDKLERVSFGDRDGTETLHIRSIGDRAFDSLEDTGLSALRTIAAAYKEVDSGDDAYVDGSSTAAEAISGEVYDLSGVTPLKYAAFGGYPPALSAVVAAKENKHSFPRDVTIWYSNPDYNRAAYGQWRSAVKPGNPMSTWNGYNCEPEWVGHFHEYGEPEIQERTCTQDGMEIYTCHVWQDGAECGHVKTVITEKATGHNSEVTMQIDADCEEDGIRYLHCSNEWCDRPNYTEVIPALGHSFADPDDYKAPTCTEAGYARGKCVRCNKQVNETYPATGHDTTYMELVQPPTCTEDGYYLGYCNQCEYGTTHKVKQTVPALGHEWDSGVIITAPTVAKEGVKRYTCTREGCGAIQDEAIPKLPGPHVHNYVPTIVKEADCQHDGEVRYECSCGLKYSEKIEKTGHTWDKGVVALAPTATTEGRMKYTCTVCGSYRFETIPATGEQQPTVHFVDVEKGAFYESAVNWAVGHTPQITKGTDATHFSPYADCTRGQAVTFLYRAAGEPEVTGIVNKFVDVHANEFFYKAVLWAVKNGITTGTDGTHFAPYETCTRAHIVTFLYRWKNQPAVLSNTIPFVDVDAGLWFTLPVLWAAERGITKGTNATHFSPYDNCTRGQIVTFLQRADSVN